MGRGSRTGTGPEQSPQLPQPAKAGFVMTDPHFNGGAKQGDEQAAEQDLNTHGSLKSERKDRIRLPATFGVSFAGDHKIWGWRPNQPKGALSNANGPGGPFGLLGQARIFTTASNL